jgi:hypothetical protein
MILFGKLVKRKKPKRADWWEIEGRLMDKGFTPREYNRFTIPEIILALENREDSDPTKPPKGARAVGHQAVLKYAQWLRSLSMRDRLKAYREGKL